MASTAVTVVFSVLEVVTTTFAAWAIVSFYRRRHFQPVVVRPVLLQMCLLIILFLAMQCFTLSVIFWGTLSCHVIFVFNNQAPLLVILLFFGRIWHIWFRFSLTKEMVDEEGHGSCNHQQKRGSIDSQKSLSSRWSMTGNQCTDCHRKGLWYFLHQQYNNKNFVFSVVICMFLVITTTPVIWYSMHPSPLRKTSACKFGLSFFYYMGCLLICIILLIYVAYRFKEVNDGFLLKYEMRGVGIGTLVFSVAWNAIYFISSYSRHVFPFHMIFPILVCVNAFYFTSYVPVRRSYAYQKLPAVLPEDFTFEGRKPKQAVIELDNLMPDEMLDVIFSSRAGIAEFTEHLIKEFSVENIQFWSDVSEFLDVKRTENESDEDFVRNSNTKAMKLFATYIKPGSVRQVNLPGKVVKAIINDLKDAILNFEELFQRLEDDCLYKIRSSRVQSRKLVSNDNLEIAKNNIYNLLIDPVQRFAFERKLRGKTEKEGELEPEMLFQV